MTGEAEAWAFIVDRHGAPGVEAACLALQDDHGQCVALLMWRTWTLAAGILVEPQTLEAAVETARIWDADILRPLRAVRRRLKAPAPGVPEAARLDLRRAVLAQELAAERTLIEALAPADPPGSQAPGPPPAPLDALRSIARLWGGEPPDDLLAKLAGG